MAMRKLNNNFNVIGKTIKNLRFEKNISQSDLARDLELLGISMHKNDIQLIENNKRTVKDFELWGFAQVFNVGIKYFFQDIQKYL